MKISKASWMILGAGVFIIILAGLGMTRVNQIKEYESLSGNLSQLTVRLNNLKPGNSLVEINEYQEQLKDVQGQVAEVKKKLDQTVISVDVTDKIYEIADFCNVIIRNIGTSGVSNKVYESVGCEATLVNLAVIGSADDIVAFVMAMNDNFSTGFINTAQLNFEQDSGTVSIQFTVYSKKESV